MEKRGISCRDYFQPIHLQPFYRSEFGYKKGDYPICENVSRRTLALPFYNDLTAEQIDFIVLNLEEVLAGKNL
jgi:perosamine synthetase